MGRMLSALQRLESGQAPTRRADPALESEPVPMTQVVRASVFADVGTSGCLSSGAFWQPFDLDALAPIVAGVAVAEPPQTQLPEDTVETPEADSPVDVAEIRQPSDMERSLDHLRTLILENRPEASDTDDAPNEVVEKCSAEETIELEPVDAEPDSAQCDEVHTLDVAVDEPVALKESQPTEEEQHAPQKMQPNPALHALTTTVLRKLPAGLPAAICVTSLGDSADASSVVAEFSQHLCEEESLRVLAIDAQCGRNSARFDCGLVQALEDPARLDEAVQPTSIDGLSILPGGVGTAANATSADGSFDELLSECSRDADLMLFDGGLASNPATLPMASACDGTIVVVRLGETNAADARRFVKSLRKSGVHVLGSIVVGAA